MITRDRAAEVIQKVIESGMFIKDYIDELEDIETCILDEKDGVHTWGAVDKELVELYNPSNAVVTTRAAKRMDELYNKYKFEPSEFEREEFEIDMEGADYE